MCFESRPYSIKHFSAAEQAAIQTALEVGVQCSSGSGLDGLLKKARRHAGSGKFSRETLVATCACLKATLEAITSHDPSDMRSSMLLQHMAMQAAFESASRKLNAMM